MTMMKMVSSSFGFACFSSETDFLLFNCVVGEERVDASPVPPTLAKNASARAFSMSSLLKRDNDPSSQVSPSSL